MSHVSLNFMPKGVDETGLHKINYSIQLKNEIIRLQENTSLSFSLSAHL